MDRLPAVIAVALAASACSKAEPTPPAPPRVEGAQVLGPRKDASTAGFCDVHVADESGPVLTLPPLAGPPPTAAPGHWRWLNVWATWCKPCVEELPRLARWREKLAAAGRPVDLAFVSVDESSADVAAFRKLHPEMPDSARLADSNKQAAWFTSLGLDAASPIPIHVFASPTGHIRCVRAGGVSERDYAVIEGLLGE